MCNLVLINTGIYDSYDKRTGNLGDLLYYYPTRLGLTSNVSEDPEIAVVNPVLITERGVETTSETEAAGVCLYVNGKSVGTTDVSVSGTYDFQTSFYGWGISYDPGYPSLGIAPFYYADYGEWGFDDTNVGVGYTIHVNVIDTSDGKDITITYRDDNLTAKDTGKAGSEFTIRDALTSKTGYVFKGWATTPNDAAVYTPGQKQEFNCLTASKASHSKF